MNVNALLKGQHQQVRELLEKLGAEEDRRQRRILVGELGHALRLHMQIEEKIVYPAAKKALHGHSGAEDLVIMSVEEHAAAARALDALEKTSSGDKRFVARAKVLQMLVLEHVRDEEEKMFPQLEAELGEPGLGRLGDLVERKMPTLQTEPRAAAAPSRSGRAASSGPTRGKNAGRGASTRRATSGSTNRGAKPSARGRAGGANKGAPRRGESRERP